MKCTHAWDVTPQEAIRLQRELVGRVSLGPLGKPIRTIAGADVSLNRFSKDAYAGIIVLSYPELVPLTYAVKRGTIEFPYIPGLLSFREIPLLRACFEELSIIPDLIMVDGQGIAHPRHLGIAAHFGVLTATPTIGCAKSILYGSGEKPTLANPEADLFDPKTKEKLGTLLLSKERSNPLIISPGHLVSFDEALAITKTCLRGYRLPEPTRQAHLLVNKFRRGELGAVLPEENQG